MGGKKEKGELGLKERASRGGNAPPPAGSAGHSWPQPTGNNSSISAPMHSTILPCILIAISRTVLLEDVSGDYKCGSLGR